MESLSEVPHSLLKETWGKSIGYFTSSNFIKSPISSKSQSLFGKMC